MDRTFLDWPFFDDGHRALAREIDVWCEDTLAPELERLGEAVPADPTANDDACLRLVGLLGGAGWLGHVVPADRGGSAPEGLDVRSICVIREALSYRSGLADVAFAMQGLGTAPITLFGRERQKGLYLPPVARGERVAAFAMSEPEAGSDPAAMATTATPDADGYLLNGTKTWISNAGIADHYVVFARTGEAPGARGISAFVVDASADGLEVSERIAAMAPHPLGTLRFRDCRVGDEALVGEVGRGFAVAMATLDVFRPTVAAAALGLARRALDEALARTSERQIGGRPLAEYQMTQDRIARMAVDVDAAALLTYRAAWAKDAGAERVTREASMAKYAATEAAQRVIDDALQLFGGEGVVAGATVERLYREVRALRIYEGTSEIQKLVIARQTRRAFDERRA